MKNNSNLQGTQGILKVCYNNNRTGLIFSYRAHIAHWEAIDNEIDVDIIGPDSI